MSRIVSLVAQIHSSVSWICTPSLCHMNLGTCWKPPGRQLPSTLPLESTLTKHQSSSSRMSVHMQSWLGCSGVTLQLGESHSIIPCTTFLWCRRYIRGEVAMRCLNTNAYRGAHADKAISQTSQQVLLGAVQVGETTVPQRMPLSCRWLRRMIQFKEKLQNQASYNDIMLLEGTGQSSAINITTYW